MNFNKRPKLLAFFSLLVGVALGLFFATVFWLPQTFRTSIEKDGTAYAWPGPSRAKESTRDKDLDGVDDGWIMLLNPRQDLQLVAVMADEDLDDLMDSCTVTIESGEASGDKFYLSVHDTNSDGKFDALEYGTKRSDSGPFCEYQDLNMDGFLDLFSDIGNKRKWIFSGNRWLKIMEVVDEGGQRVMALKDGEKIEYLFQDRKWVEVLVERSESAE